MKIESSEFEHGIVYFKQFGAERVKMLCIQRTLDIFNVYGYLVRLIEQNERTKCEIAYTYICIYNDCFTSGDAK